MTWDGLLFRCKSLWDGRPEHGLQHFLQLRQGLATAPMPLISLSRRNNEGFSQDIRDPGSNELLTYVGTHPGLRNYSTKTLASIVDWTVVLVIKLSIIKHNN